MPKKFLLPLLFFWGFCALWPTSRQNLEVLVTSSGTELDDTDYGGLFSPGDSGTDTQPGPFLSDAESQGLASNSFKSADILLKTVPPRPQVLAWWLCANCAGLDVQPLASPIPYGMDEWVPRPTAYAKIMKVARLGEKADPGNAFFPWMASQAEMAVLQERAATWDLHRAADCPRYEDYVLDFYQETRQYAAQHPLMRPCEDFSLWWGRAVPVEGIGLATQQVTTSFPLPPNPMITDPDVLRHFEMTSLIFRMGLKQRAHATALVTRLQGTLMELATIDHAYFYYMGTMGQEFGPPLSIPNTDDFVLTGDWKSYSCIYRASLWYQKTELLRLMNREWKLARPDLSSRGAQAVWASPPRHAATALSEVERLQRLLLWSLALPLLLLWPLYRVRTVTLGPEEGPSWQAALRGGAFSGLFCLAGLLVGDWSIATRSLAYWGVVVRDRSVMAAAPGLPVVMPAVPIAAAAILVLAWAVILTIREHFPPDTHGANDVSLFDFVMICRSSVLFGIWGIALLSFFAACWWALDDHGEPSSFTAWLPAYSQALVLALGVAALLPWWLVRFKDRRRAAGRLRLRLRGMLWGYIALATVLFAGLEGVRLAEHSVMERAIGNLMLN